MTLSKNSIMQTNPSISVTIVTYNHEKYVGEAIDSILNQTFENFELIIVNDGSTDRTEEIIQGFKDRRIKYIYQTNQGPSAAANTAVLNARGEYLALMCGDDVCYPDRLEKQYKFLSKSKKESILFSWVDFIDENSQIITEGHFAKNLFNHPERTRSEILRYFFFKGNYINGVSGFIPRKFLLDAGLYNLSSIQLQDFEMWIKLIKKYDIHVLPEPLIKYRVVSTTGNLSNPSNYLRSDFEDRQIYSKMFDAVPIDLFKDAFQDIIIKPNFTDGIEYELEKAFLYLRHDSTLIQNIGCEKLYSLLQDTDILHLSISSYKFASADLYKLTNTIDFQNKKRLNEIYSAYIQKDRELSQAQNILIENQQYEVKRNTEFLSSKVFSFSFHPLISIIFPVFNTPENYLRDAIESVLTQVYPYWELCIADDASTEPHVKKILQEYAQRDARIKVVYRTENGHISRTSNSAIEIATGEFIALLDHDDLLTSDALYEVAVLLNQHPDADMIYSDEDKVNDNHQFIFPTYKPDWCPDSFLSRMYTCHLGVYRRSLINEIGGFRVGYEGSQDYDLVLRFTEKTDKIFHIPKILYHWRLHAGSTSASTSAKTYAYEAGFKALTDAVNRRGENGIILSDPNIPGHYHARYEVRDCKLVSIIIVISDNSLNIDRCLESIFAKTSYQNYEVVVINNDVTKTEIKTIVDKWKSLYPDILRYYSHNTSFNSSKLNNYAVTKAQGDYLLFLSNDIQITQHDWLSAMVEQAQRKSIGAVGTFLLDSHGAIQHVGTVIGLGEVSSHIYKGISRIEEYETLAYVSLIKNVSAITRDCLMCRRDIFESIGGFDETLPVVYNDVDLCLSTIAKGYRNIVIPHVKLNHQELTTWQVTSNQKERSEFQISAAEIMRNKWGKALTYDPCLSPNIIRDINSKRQADVDLIVKFKNQQIEYKADNTSEPLVSVCIPTYNGAQFIEEAIDSILSQTYPNLEIIISDDGSIDRTVEIAKLLQQKTSYKFSILEHGQYGLSQNWNFCISQAQGKYIKFLFQDDLLEPHAIKEMVDLAEHDEEIGLVFSPRKLFTNTDNTYYDSNFLSNHEAKDVHKAWSNLKSIQSGQEFLQDPNILNSPINKVGEPSTVLIKKEVFDTVGVFNPDFCQLVDLEMWLRIMSQYKVGYVDRVLSKFRIHAQQQTQRNSVVKNTIFLDYQRFFQTISNDTRYPQSMRAEALYRYSALRPQGADLEKLCRKFAENLLDLSDSQLVNWYQGATGKTHKILVSSGIRYINLPEKEQIFVDNIIANLQQGLDKPQAIQTLLSGMLYYRPDELPLQPDLSCIPDWLLSDYLQFLFSSSVNFILQGEADNYYKYIHCWVTYLQTSILSQPDRLFWKDIANKFTQVANFISAYFNEANLKDIYVKRAEIIELNLENNGHKVDYDFSDRSASRKKIRVGILASHFNPSAETFATLPVYEYLSRDFEVVLYSLQQNNHPLEQYCRSSANFFVTLPQNLSEQVDAIRGDDLDILFFATNVTAVTNQICLLASHRLARIQITSGGSVVTTGMRHMDYFISGTFTDPSPTAQEQYQEELIKLPGAAHCFSYGDFEEKSTIKVEREQLGIPEDSVVFTSGANFYKIIPELIHTWAKIIAAVPNSTIVLFPFGPNWSSNYPKQAFEKHLHGIFAEYGVSAERVLALDPQPVPNREDLKEYFKIADVYLDSYPFAGTTSLIEPLQVNLPVIARQGNSFRSAMGSAMIRSLEITDLVADSEESYIHLAVALGNNLELRQQKSAEIKAKMQNNPSFLDSKGYGAKIDKLFKELFDRYSANTLSDNLRLRDVNLMVFPDWNQSEESVGLELQQVIQTLATQPDSQKTTLLIDTTNIEIEDAEMFISSVAMNLMMEEDLDITEELEISLIEDLSNIQWDKLLPRIDARIILECDNQAVVGKFPHEKLLQRQLESFIVN